MLPRTGLLSLVFLAGPAAAEDVTLAALGVLPAR
jgi:hypothetical protein